jgi:hypothetical protein
MLHGAAETALVPAPVPSAERPSTLRRTPRILDLSKRRYGGRAAAAQRQGGHERCACTVRACAASETAWLAACSRRAIHFPRHSSLKSARHSDLKLHSTADTRGAAAARAGTPRRGARLLGDKLAAALAAAGGCCTQHPACRCASLLCSTTPLAVPLSHCLRGLRAPWSPSTKRTTSRASRSCCRSTARAPMCRAAPSPRAASAAPAARP